MQLQTSRLTKTLLTLLGMLLIGGAFAGVVITGALRNPPAIRVVIATHDMQVGEQLDVSFVAIEPQTLNPQLAALYVTEQELASFKGRYVVDIIRRGDPLNKAKFASELSTDTPSGRYGLVLTDATQVVMVMPVSPDLIPSQIKAGDFINIIYAAGSNTPLGQSSLSGASRPTTIDYHLSITDTASGAVPTPEATPTAAPPALPLADVLLQHVEILDVHFQQVQNPAYGNGNAQSKVESPWLNGPISSIVVRVPESYQAILMFALANGQVRYAISSPMLSASSLRPHAGVAWQDIEALYQWKQSQALARGESLTSTLYPLYAPTQPQASLKQSKP